MVEKQVDVIFINNRSEEVYRVSVQKGSKLLDACLQAGMTTGYCGGNGDCGLCYVELADGREVLSCRETVDETMVVKM